MGSSPMSISSIQLSSPLPSPSATPNRQTQDALNNQRIRNNNSHHTSSQPSQPMDSPNAIFLPPLVFNSPQNTSHSSSTIYPLADTTTPPELKRIKFTLDNRQALLQEIDASDPLLQQQLDQQYHSDYTQQSTYSGTKRPEDLSTSEESLQRKRLASTQLEGMRTFISPPNDDFWSPRELQYNDTITNITPITNTTTANMDNVPLPSDINPAYSSSQSANLLNNSNPVVTSTPASNQSLVSLLPEFATHLPSADGVETNMADSPNSALPSPVSDLDPNDENWASTTSGGPTATMMDTDSPMDDDIDDSSNNDVTNGPDHLSSLFRTYDSLPNGIQDYFMFQLLRRSSMTSLRFASDMIMQSLRLDFISRLPRHISRRILLFVDPPSLCRAIGVSRFWKHAIEEDSTLWRAKFVEYGFTVTADEIERYDLTTTHLAHQYQQPPLQHIHQYYQQMHQIMATTSTTTTTAFSSSSSSKAPVKSEVNLNSPYLFPISEIKHEDTEFLDRFLFNTPTTTYPSSDPTLLHRTSLSSPDYDSPDDDVWFNDAGLRVSHPFKELFRSHYTTRQNWKHDRVKRLQVKGHDDVVTCLQFDDDKIITGFDDNYINVHDIKTGLLRRVLRGHEGGVWALQYVGNTLVTGSTDRTIRVWDIEHGICRFVFRGHTSTVRCLHIVLPTPVHNGTSESSIQPAQPLIVSGSRDSTLRVWKLPYLPVKSQVKQHQQYPHEQYKYQHQQHHQYQQRQQYHQQTYTQPDPDHYPFDQQSQQFDTLRFERHYRQPKDSSIDDEETRTNNRRQLQSQLQRFINELQSDSFQSQQQHQQHYHFQHQQTQEHDFNPFFVHLLEGHKDSVRALAAHGNCLASGSYDNLVKLWDLDTGTLKFTLEGHTQKVYSVAIDAQRQWCISGSMDSTIRIWNILDGSCVRVLRGHTILVGLLGLSTDHLVSGGADGTLRVWSADSGEREYILDGHKGAITSFQHDDHKVISGSEGGLKMWDIRTGKFMRDLITDVNGIWRVAFDERRCVAAVKCDNTTRLEILDYGDNTEDGM